MKLFENTSLSKFGLVEFEFGFAVALPGGLLIRSLRLMVNTLWRGLVVLPLLPYL
jgi:hypothetical protein